MNRYAPWTGSGDVSCISRLETGKHRVAEDKDETEKTSKSLPAQ